MDADEVVTALCRVLAERWGVKEGAVLAGLLYLEADLRERG